MQVSRREAQCGLHGSTKTKTLLAPLSPCPGAWVLTYFYSYLPPVLSASLATSFPLLLPHPLLLLLLLLFFFFFPTILKRQDLGKRKRRRRKQPKVIICHLEKQFASVKQLMGPSEKEKTYPSKYYARLSEVSNSNQEIHQQIAVEHLLQVGTGLVGQFIKTRNRCYQIPLSQEGQNLGRQMCHSKQLHR